MSVIDIRNLGGMYPSTLPRNLPDNGAQEAHNLLPNTTEFRPLGADTTVATTVVNNPQTLYRFARKVGGDLNNDDTTGWTVAAGVRHYVKGPLNDDITERTYFTGDGAPKATDLTGAVRQLGVPAPTAAPTVVLNEVYSFTRERRDAEIASAITLAMESVKTVGVTPAYVGLADDVDLEGWILRGDIEGVTLDKQTLRVFAVNPSTNAIIDTYSTLPPDEAGWVLDPALGGYYGTLGAGVTLPGWAAGHSKWWCIPMTAYAQVFDINAVALKAALMDIDKPGTQGAEKLLTDPQAQTFVDKFTELADKDATTIKPLIDALKAKQQDIVELFNQGGKPTLLKAVTDFYAQADVSNAIESAKTAFAEAIWVHVRAIGTAAAPDFA